MSSHYKSLISKEIIKSLRNCTAIGENSRTIAVEGQIYNVINVLPTSRNSENSESQFVIRTADLDHCLQTKINVPSLTLNGIQSKLESGKVFFQIKPSDFAQKVLKSVLKNGPRYGYRNLHRQRKTICVEFSSPNIAKPFHVGHMRSTIIGNVISNMYEAASHDVKRLNFLGDWGTQFGLLALGVKQYCEKENLTTISLEELLKAYVKINEDVSNECSKGKEMDSETYQEGLKLFARLEKGDPDLLSLWQKIKDASIKDLEKMYKRLGVRFTHVMGESDYYEKTDEVLTCLRDASLLEYDSQGVGFVNLDNISKTDGKAVVVKSDGSSLYLTRDIAAALDRHQLFNIDKMHYVVEQGQRSHFIKLVNVLKHLGIPWANRPVEEIHVRFGRVEGMSTRAGTSILLTHLLDKAIDRVTQAMKKSPNTRVTDTFSEVAETLAVSAIILQDLRDNRAKNYKFKWNRMLSFKTDSGVFVQYCHARLTRLINNCGVEVASIVAFENLEEDKSLHKIILHLASYPDVFETALESLNPHLIVQYLCNLCHLVNLAYSECPVKGQPTDIAQARLIVFIGAKQVLVNCLHLLGIQPLDEM